MVTIAVYLTLLALLALAPLVALLLVFSLLFIKAHRAWINNLQAMVDYIKVERENLSAAQKAVEEAWSKLK